jgi:hypothetical protein
MEEVGDYGAYIALLSASSTYNTKECNLFITNKEDIYNTYICIITLKLMHTIYQRNKLQTAAHSTSIFPDKQKKKKKAAHNNKTSNLAML